MLELILGLFCLFCSLLFLDDGESVFRLLWLALAETLSSFILDLVLLIISGVYSLPLISNLLLPRVHSPNTKRFLVRCPIIECFLIVVVEHMHTQALIWKPTPVIPAVLRHLINLKHFLLGLSGLLSVQTLRWAFGGIDLNVLLLPEFILKL